MTTMKITLEKQERPCQNHRMKGRLPLLMLATALSCGNALGDALSDALAAAFYDSVGGMAPGEGALWVATRPPAGAWGIALVLLAIAVAFAPVTLYLVRWGHRRLVALPPRQRILAVIAFSAIVGYGGQKGFQTMPGTLPNATFPALIANVPPVIASAPAQQPRHHEHTREGRHCEERTRGCEGRSKATQSPSRQSLLPPDFVPGMRPEWWHYDMTDSCGCGMPDLWRKWVRLDPCGHDLDRDNDGLTELEEWWHQCDPRTADTMGHGIHDGWLVARGYDPLDREIASQPCPNGLTLLETFLFGAEPDDPILPITLPDGEYGVTFTLASPIPQGAVGVLELDGQRFPLTASSNAVTVLFPEDGLFDVSFAPPKRMEDMKLALSGALQGLYLYDPDGIFGDPMPQTPGTRGAKNTLGRTYIGVDPERYIFHGGTGEVRFEATHLPPGAYGDNVTWLVYDGMPYPGTEIMETNALSVTFTPDPTAGATVIVSVPAVEGDIRARGGAGQCDYPGLGVRLAITNGTSAANPHMMPHDDPSDNVFSPHLGETIAFLGEWDPGYCIHTSASYACTGDLLLLREGEVILALREDLPLIASTIFHTNWDGRVSVSEAISSDLFTNGLPEIAVFNRILPASSDIIPPPFFDVAAQVKSNGVIAAAVTNRVWVPQVVKVAYSNDVIPLLTEPIVYTNSTSPLVTTNIYAGCLYEEAVEFLANGLPAAIQERFGAGVNIRFVGHNTPADGAHTIEVNANSSPNYGEVKPTPKPRNATQPAHAFLFPQAFRDELIDEYKDSVTTNNPAGYINLWDVLNSPAVTFGQFKKAVAENGAHETGHMLGLVNKNFLSGDDLWHYTSSTPQYLMNTGEFTSTVWRFLWARGFNTLDADYLIFTLPKPY
ncbi:MAG: hypothetical protein FWF84_02045 [Kiritimatiellaeota bacterium]|nr:hypothetical protein [Kiritimatiellota bacterium]